MCCWLGYVEIVGGWSLLLSMLLPMFRFLMFFIHDRYRCRRWFVVIGVVMNGGNTDPGRPANESTVQRPGTCVAMRRHGS